MASQHTTGTKPSKRKRLAENLERIFSPSGSSAMEVNPPATNHEPGGASVPHALSGSLSIQDIGPPMTTAGDESIADPTPDVLMVHDAAQSAPAPPAISAASEPKLKGGARKVWDTIITTLRVAKEASDALPQLKSVVGGILAVNDLIEATRNNRETYQEMQFELGEQTKKIKLRLEALSEVDENDISGALTHVSNAIDGHTQHIKAKLDRNRFVKGIESNTDKDDISNRYRQIEGLFRDLDTEINFRILMTTTKLHSLSLFNVLSPVGDALYNSGYSDTIGRSTCTPDTRVDILQGARNWATNSGPEKVYLMYGMAGTGKTTISPTFLRSRSSPQCQDVNNIIPTIAYQLASYSGAYRSKLHSVLEKDPLINRLNVNAQIEKLIKEPLNSIPPVGLQEAVVVIDALDECGDARATGRFLVALLKVVHQLPIKFFLTSRPETHIQSQLSYSQGMAPILILHDIEESIVNADIKTYLIESLAAMSPRPLFKQIERLARRAGKLFIYAATAVRYISPDDPDIDSADRLQKVLEMNTSATRQHEEIDVLYMNVLSAACRRLDKDEVNRLYLTLWTVVCAKEPMTIQMLSLTLNIMEGQIQVALRRLVSVLHIQQGIHGLVAPFHASFPDFIFAQCRSNMFYCNKGAHSTILAKGCFNVMKNQLVFNICNLESSFIFDKDDLDLEDRVKACIPVSLSYASRFWADHLVESESSDTLNPNLIDFLSHRLLFWMEVLNLMGCISTAVHSLQRVLRWLGGAEGRN